MTNSRVCDERGKRGLSPIGLFVRRSATKPACFQHTNRAGVFPPGSRLHSFSRPAAPSNGRFRKTTHCGHLAGCRPPTTALEPTLERHRLMLAAVQTAPNVPDAKQGSLPNTLASQKNSLIKIKLALFKSVPYYAFHQHKTKHTIEGAMENQPTLQDVRNNLIATLYGIASTLDIQVREGAGAAMLGLPEGTPVCDFPDFANFDLSMFSFERDIKEVYSYAFHGELGVRGQYGISEDSEDGNIGRLAALCEIADYYQFNRNMEDFEDSVVGTDAANNHALKSMVKLAQARHNLDCSGSVSLQEIALLSGLNERSVRNAMYADGNAMLAAVRNEEGELVVNSQEALNWLKGRRNFKETVQIGTKRTLPASLASNEIMPFLNAEFHEFYHASNLEIPGHPDLFPKLSEEELITKNFANAANNIGWPPERLRKVLSQPIENLSPEDCPALSRMLYIDTTWLTAHVMQARFPDAMKELQPLVAAPKAAFSPLNEAEGTLEVVLTEAGIRNGYFDIERRYADRFFPADCFGSRGKENEGIKNVWLHHDGKGSPYDTNLRVKSEALVSPRKRFSAYFTAHSSKAGDVIRIKKVGERSYELTYLQKQGA